MISVERGEIWMTNLNPTKGSEQSGFRPVIIFQNDKINKFTSTVLVIPLTSNLRRANLPTSVLIQHEKCEILIDSVALCHQIRVLDKSRLENRIGKIDPQTIIELEQKILFTMGII
jgi:mRNA interferase MazF